LIQKNDKVKILGTGELKAKLNFKVNAVSEKAKSAIEAAGGTIEILK
jgi:large subunit ribosomal protein L15